MKTRTRPASHFYAAYTGRRIQGRDGRGRFEHKIQEHSLVECRRCRKAPGAACFVCGRRKGCTDDYGGTVPMGPIGRCRDCKKLVCPVCESNRDCCLKVEEDREEAAAGVAPSGAGGAASPATSGARTGGRGRRRATSPATSGT